MKIFRASRRMGKRLLVPGMISGLLFSCKKFEPADLPASPVNREPTLQSSVSINLSSSNLIYEEIFEGLGPFFYPGTIQTGTSYGFTLSTNHYYQGLKAARFELRDTDPSVSSGTRSEAKYPVITNTNRWYSFGVYFPYTDYKYDSKAEIISQWHQGGGANPSMSLITRANRIYLEVRPNPSTKYQYDLGSIPKDTWQSYVFHINHLHSSSGIVEVWRNGVKIFTRQGSNAYDYSSYDKPYWKIGLYKWEWNGTQTSDVSRRVIYFDNVREGNENASYSDMVKTANTNLNPPGTVSSFTLVNADTEKDVLTIKNGSIISLSAISGYKLNIRANAGTKFGCVRFELTGPQTRSSKDNAFPYTIMGDDNNANYYYGCWGPAAIGTYNLIATPYSNSDGTGLVGYKSTISFSIVK